MRSNIFGPMPNAMRAATVVIRLQRYVLNYRNRSHLFPYRMFGIIINMYASWRRHIGEEPPTKRYRVVLYSIILSTAYWSVLQEIKKHLKELSNIKQSHR